MPFISTSQSDQARLDYTLLQNLKIDESKRELRLASKKNETPALHISVYKQYKKNRFLEIVEALERLPEKERSAELSLIYGSALFFLGKDEEAVAAYQKAFESAVSPQVKAAAMANFGWALSKKGKPQVAAHWLERALLMDRERGDWAAQGQALSQLGNLYIQLGDTEKGASAHIEALEIAETVPIPWLEAKQLNLLATFYYLDGTVHIANDYYRKALGIYRRLGDPLGEAAALTGLGFIDKDRERYDPALGHQKEVLSIYRRLNDALNATKAMVNLVLIHRDKGDFQAALDMGTHVVSIHIKTGNKNGMAEIEGTIGTVYEKKGDFAQAIHHFEIAKKNFQEAGATQEIHIVELRIQVLQDRMK